MNEEREIFYLAAQEYFDNLTDEERLRLMSDYCHFCGKDITEEKCYCSPNFDE